MALKAPWIEELTITEKTRDYIGSHLPVVQTATNEIASDWDMPLQQGPLDEIVGVSSYFLLAAAVRGRKVSQIIIEQSTEK